MAAGLGFKTFTTGEVLTAADTNGYLMQGVLVFASAAARDAAITSPQEGQCCYLKDTDAVLTYSGAAWVGFDDSNAIQNSIVDAKGDLISATADNTPARLGIGTNNQVLTADSAQATGMKWATPAGGGGKVLQVVQDTLTSSFTTTSTTMADTGLSVTITPSSATSQIMVYVSVPSADATLSGTGGLGYGAAQLLRGATVLQYAEIGSYNVASATNPSFLASMSMSYLDSPATTSATTYKVQSKKETGTSFAFSASATKFCSIVVMEIGA